jgi:formiminoglutamase
MAEPSVPRDPHWPKAGEWLTRPAEPGAAHGDLAFLGVPAQARSISRTGAHATPAAVREALSRYSLFAPTGGVNLSALCAVDLGDVEDPDGPGGETRTARAAADAARRFGLVLGIGGDNSITYSLMRGLAGDALAQWGLITVDAHHDLRDGTSNGSPVRRLVEAGLPGENIVQIGIADFANSAFYAERAREYGITVIPRAEFRTCLLPDIAARALEIAGRGDRPVFLDLDMDVCDRAVVPGCPAAAPGGISADELRHITRLLARDPRVRGIDITEVDATADTEDGRTVRLAALLALETAAGLALRVPAI